MNIVNRVMLRFVTDIRQTIGRNLRLLRSRKGLSQEEVAHRAELDRSYMWGLEKGVRNPSVLVIERLARVLGVKPHELLEPSLAGRIGASEAR